MKNLKDYFDNHSQFPELEKKTWKQGGVNWEDFKKYPNDYLVASTGSVPGMIYYEDTVKFAKDNLKEIQELVKNTEYEYGFKLDVPDFLENEEQYYNWIAWFSWESLSNNLENYLDL